MPAPAKLPSSPKVMDRAALRLRVAQWKAAGQPITLANGCFDLLHVGHIRYLRAAKALGGRLIVAVNSDSSTRAIKGPDRPHIAQADRAELLAALSDVDAVVIFDEPDVRALVRELRPNIHAKGTDYTPQTVPERDVVIECGGRVAIVGDPKDHSSTALRQRIPFTPSASPETARFQAYVPQPKKKPRSGAPSSPASLPAAAAKKSLGQKSRPKKSTKSPKRKSRSKR